jgi:hypothetical protein
VPVAETTGAAGADVLLEAGPRLTAPALVAHIPLLG